MKSTLRYGGEEPPEPIRGIVNKFIEEWGRYTRGIGEFYYGSHPSQPFVWLMCDDRPNPIMDLSYEGSVLSYSANCRTLDKGGVFCPSRSTGCLQELRIRLPQKRGCIRTTSPVELSSEIGVGDIFNLLPHEYGYLKLKYGLHKDELFIPSVVRGLFTNTNGERL